jgi:hypothetical protein
MSCEGFEPTIPASERAKTVYVLDRLATVTDRNNAGGIIQENSLLSSRAA